MTERFYERFCRLADQNLRVSLASVTCSRLARTFAMACSQTVVLATLVFTVAMGGDEYGDTPRSSSIGLALNSSLAIPMTMAMLCVTFLGMTQIMVSLERDIEYTELPKEVGVVGRTGAGKSSLVLALLRVLKSTGGRIVIDNVDIASVPLSRLRTAVTVIPQDPSLVRGTLRGNLDPTQQHSDDELWKVLRQAHLADFVSSQPLKLLLETGDGGGNLSAGQRQLVCLARALLRKPKILVLDEATSHMDGDTDRMIQATLRGSFAKFTLLTVAHRLHTVLDYDRVLVMSEGSVAEYGTVQQLLSDSNSLFYDMARQAGVVFGDLQQNNLLHSSETHTHL
ncbi:ATP-binding cassette sub-family C member 2-like isoform X2 [Dermacentor albipictus]|uniref:ATP-binding cassette sub-family C member 2-like isoform X2 n=1 Tax=Dermacentor albipictus TaxID=60249 RepID=UPI0038FC868C